MARAVGLDIIVYQVILIVLIVIVRIGRRSDIPYIGVHLIVISNSRYYIYIAKPS